MALYSKLKKGIKVKNVQGLIGSRKDQIIATTELKSGAFHSSGHSYSIFSFLPLAQMHKCRKCHS